MTIDHGRIKALFQAAIDREDPAERLEYLDREIGNDTDLRDRLDDLLAVYDRPPARSTAPSMPAPWPLKTSIPVTHPDVNN